MKPTTSLISILVVSLIAMTVISVHADHTAQYWRKQYDELKQRQESIFEAQAEISKSIQAIPREVVMSSWSYPAGYLNKPHRTSQVCVELHTISVGHNGALGPVIHVDGMYQDVASQYAYGPINLEKAITAEFTLKQSR